MKVAILGYGNIGAATEQAVLAAGDMQLAGVYHHNEVERLLADARQGKVDVVVLSLPSREVPEYAQRLLEAGVSTVDSFDIHSQIVATRRQLSAVAQKGGAVSVLSAGWDPGSDSVVRCLMEAIAPKGLTYTNFGPGRSMGHSVAAKSVKGVKDALSMTIPIGTGLHRRMVYVELEEGTDFAAVEKAILADDYFCHDETHVISVPCVDALNNVAHGVNLVRSGVSGTTHNQRLEFNMMINNPALTGQVLVAAARAAVRLRAEQRSGCYTLIELPPIYLMEGSDEDIVGRLV